MAFHTVDAEGHAKALRQIMQPRAVRRLARRAVLGQITFVTHPAGGLRGRLLVAGTTVSESLEGHRVSCRFAVLVARITEIRLMTGSTLAPVPLGEEAVPTVAEQWGVSAGPLGLVAVVAETRLMAE